MKKWIWSIVASILIILTVLFTTGQTGSGPSLTKPGGTLSGSGTPIKIGTATADDFAFWGASDSLTAIAGIAWETAKWNSAGTIVSDYSPTNVGEWEVQNLAASQTDLVMSADGGFMTGGSGGSSRLIIPFPGAIVGLTIRGNAAVTTDSCYFKAFVNNVATTAKISLSLETGTQRKGIAIVPIAFNAGDELDIRATTTGTFAPTTTEYVVTLWVVF